MKSKEHIISIAMLLLITYTASLSFVSQAFPAGQQSHTLSSTGNIQIQATTGVGIYSNYQCTSELTSLSWGTLEPGETSTITCYIKNEGDTTIILSLETSNWSPSSASNYLACFWDYNGAQIAAGQVATVNLSLSASANTQGITNFGFDVTIIGSGS